MRKDRAYKDLRRAYRHWEKAEAEAARLSGVERDEHDQVVIKEEARVALVKAAEWRAVEAYGNLASAVSIFRAEHGD